MRFLSLMSTLLMAVSSAKRISDLCALSMNSQCLVLTVNRVLVHSNPAFMLKSITSAFTSRTVNLTAFYPPPHTSEEDRRLNLLCPVRTLACYVQNTSLLSKSDQLFIFYGAAASGLPVLTQQLAYRLCDAISEAHAAMGSGGCMLIPLGG